MTKVITCGSVASVADAGGARGMLGGASDGVHGVRGGGIDRRIGDGDAGFMLREPQTSGPQKRADSLEVQTPSGLSEGLGIRNSSHARLISEFNATNAHFSTRSTPVDRLSEASAEDDDRSYPNRARGRGGGGRGGTSYLRNPRGRGRGRGRSHGRGRGRGRGRERGAGNGNAYSASLEEEADVALMQLMHDNTAQANHSARPHQHERHGTEALEAQQQEDDEEGLEYEQEQGHVVEQERARLRREQARGSELEYERERLRERQRLQQHGQHGYYSEAGDSRLHGIGDRGGWGDVRGDIHDDDGRLSRQSLGSVHEVDDRDLHPHFPHHIQRQHGQQSEQHQQHRRQQQYEYEPQQRGEAATHWQNGPSGYAQDQNISPVTDPLTDNNPNQSPLEDPDAATAVFRERNFGPPGQYRWEDAQDPFSPSGGSGSLKRSPVGTPTSGGRTAGRFASKGGGLGRSPVGGSQRERSPRAPHRPQGGPQYQRELSTSLMADGVF